MNARPVTATSSFARRGRTIARAYHAASSREVASPRVSKRRFPAFTALFAALVGRAG